MTFAFTKYTSMEEPKSSDLLQKMITMFPYIPYETIQHYVKQNLQDENACIKLLCQLRNSHSSTVNNVGDSNNIMPQLSNLNTEKLQNPYASNVKINPNRSISDVVIPRSLASDNAINLGPCTAPVQSGSYLGVPFFFTMHGNHAIYTSNNNMLYQPGMANVDNGLLLQVTNDSYARSNSPRLENLNASGTSPKNTHINASTNSRSHSPRPYVYSPQGNPIVFPPNNMRAASPLAENPNRSRTPSISNENGTLDHNSQLHINIEPNDNPAHEWLPYTSFPISPNYPQLSPMPIQLLPSLQGQMSGHLNPTVCSPEFKTLESMHSPPIWPPTSMSIIPPQSLSYSPQFYVPASSSMFLQDNDLVEYLDLQKQRLNSLRYEIEKNKNFLDALQKESIEFQMQADSCQRNISDVSTLKEDIESLSKECSILYEEVDEHIQGKARLGEINDDFYGCLNTGQQGPLIPPRPVRTKTKTNVKPPCKHERQYTPEEDEENKESSKWKCPKCTFANHPAISVCEMCIEPRNIHNPNEFVEAR